MCSPNWFTPEPDVVAEPGFSAFIKRHNKALTFHRLSNDTAFSSHWLLPGTKQPATSELTGNYNMKKIIPLAVLAISLALTACGDKTADTIKEKADDAKQAVAAKADEANEAADKKIEEAKEEAKEKAPAAAAALDTMADQAKDATQDATDATKKAAGKAVDKVQDAASTAVAPAPGPEEETKPTP